VLAYVTWHGPDADADTDSYVSALEHFHSSLAHVPPSGFLGSCSFRIAGLPWRGEGGDAGRDAYEDWYLIDSWAALGVLEEAAVSHGHVSRHEAIAAHAASTIGAVYRRVEGQARPEAARVAVWVAAGRGHVAPTLADLLGDGMDPEAAALWRRCIGLGPAPEYCLLAAEVPAGVAPARLPAGWSARADGRQVLWQAPAPPA
jgi:hypothetical protein